MSEFTSVVPFNRNLPAYRYPTFSELAAKILDAMEEDYKKSMDALRIMQGLYPQIVEIVEGEKFDFPIDVTATKEYIFCQMTLKSHHSLSMLVPVIKKLKKAIGSKNVTSILRNIAQPPISISINQIKLVYS